MRAVGLRSSNIHVRLLGPRRGAGAKRQDVSKSVAPDESVGEVLRLHSELQRAVPVPVVRVGIQGEHVVSCGPTVGVNDVGEATLRGYDCYWRLPIPRDIKAECKRNVENLRQRTAHEIEQLKAAHFDTLHLNPCARGRLTINDLVPIFPGLFFMRQVICTFIV